MGAHNDTANDYKLFQDGTQSPVPPASGGTFNIGGKDRCIFTVGAGTYELPDNVPLGISFKVYATGAVTINTQAAVTMATLSSGQVAEFTARTSTTWNVTVHSTTGATSLNQISTTLTSTLGTVPIPLMQWREVVSNDIAALATAGATGSGGTLATDTAPTLEYVNGDTDSSLRILWATSNVDPIVTQVMIPFDCDTTQPILFKVAGLMSGTTNTPVISLDTYYRDGGGSVSAKIEDDTSAFSDAVETRTATIAASDFPAVSVGVPVWATIELTPGSHGTDTLTIYGTYLQYTKKLVTA